MHAFKMQQLQRQLATDHLRLLCVHYCVIVCMCLYLRCTGECCCLAGNVMHLLSVLNIADNECCVERVCSGERSRDDGGILWKIIWTERRPRLERYEHRQLHKWQSIANIGSFSLDCACYITTSGECKAFVSTESLPVSEGGRHS